MCVCAAAVGCICDAGGGGLYILVLEILNHLKLAHIQTNPPRLVCD